MPAWTWSTQAWTWTWAWVSIKTWTWAGLGPENQVQAQAGLQDLAKLLIPGGKNYPKLPYIPALCLQV